MDFSNYKFRCSALGNIVTPSGKLIQSSETYLTELFIGELYGVKKEAYGKALDKGVACEPDGFKMANDVLYPGRFVAKEKEGRENEWLKGTPDFIVDGVVTDIKNAWDRFSFGKADLTHLYKTQLLGYMNLLGLKKGILFYCLVNLPEHMVQDEERKLFYTKREWLTMEDPAFLKACEELREAHNYDKIPIWERFKVWEVEYTDEWEKKMQSCVTQARCFLNNLYEKHQERIEYNKSLTIKELQKHE